MSYNYFKDSWSLNELSSHYVQEKERLKQEKTESAHLATASKDKKKTTRERRVRKLRFQHRRTNNIRNRLKMVVSYVELQGTRRSNAPTITHGVLRKVCFLI